MKLLLIGRTGQIGGDLCQIAPLDWAVQATDRQAIDFAKPETIRPALERFRPNVIVNAAGYTAVDRAESEPEVADLINGTAVGVLAEEAARLGAALIQYSTDYVYDGCKTSLYQPTDAPNPRSAYGRSKLAGERAIVDAGVSHVILRTQWVYSLTGRNFVLAILRQGALKPELPIVNDQRGSPTWASAIAQATIDIIECGLRLSASGSDFGDRGGTYHLACGGSATWFEFAQAVFEEASKRLPGRAIPNLTPISTVEYGARAVRPACAILDCSATERAFGVHMPQWRDALHEAMQDSDAIAKALA